MSMRALIADDDPMSRRMLELVLGKLGYEIIAETNGLAALERLTSADGPQLAILDWMMPQLDGLEVVRRLRARPDAPYVYTLLLTSKTQSADIVKGLESGADDYVLKPFNINELQARLRAGERVLSAQRALVQARETVRASGAIDSATGVFGSGALIPVLARDLARARYERMPLSVAMFAVDAATDAALPREAKDMLLVTATQRLATMIRPADALVRVNDDVVCAILPNTSSRDAIAFAEQLRGISQAENVLTPKGVLSAGCSFGLASFDGSPIDAAGLIEMARQALEQARSSSQGRIVASTRAVGAAAGNAAGAPPPMPPRISRTPGGRTERSA